MRTLIPTLLALSMTAAAQAGVQTSDRSSPGQPDPQTLEQLEKAEDLSKAFAWAASIVQGSVVEIRTVETAQQRRPLRGAQGLRMGMGTGVILSGNGRILTNNHVIDGAEEILITLIDDREFEAQVVGRDPATDLALLKIDATNLKPATLADSDKASVGQWVIAVGSPFGLEQSVTAGIISATRRQGLGLALYEDWLQTDAAINPGNSGGPLVNLRGEVVGINTAIRSDTGMSQGVGFAIPSNMARQISDRLARDGEIIRGYMGITLVDVDDDAAEFLDFTGTDGIVVTSVTRNSPAAEAGVEAHDIITHVNRRRVQDATSFREMIADLGPGTRAPIDVFRDGSRQRLLLTVGKRPEMTRRQGR